MREASGQRVVVFRNYLAPRPAYGPRKRGAPARERRAFRGVTTRDKREGTCAFATSHLVRFKEGGVLVVLCQHLQASRDDGARGAARQRVRANTRGEVGPGPKGASVSSVAVNRKASSAVVLTLGGATTRALALGGEGGQVREDCVSVERRDGRWPLLTSYA